MSVPKARTNSAAQSQECCNEPERDCIWRNNTHTPTPPPSKLDQALLRDCTNYNYKYNHECSFPIIDDSTTNTPSTVLSSASTRSKSFEENLATITSMSTGAINNINVKEIANEPNLAIPNLSPRPGAIMSQSGDANRSRLSSQRDVNNNISAIVGPTINNSDGNSSSSSNINDSSDNNMNANSLHMHPFPNFGTQDKMHSLSHIHNASVSSLANDMKIQSQPSFGSAAFAATNAAISVTRPENTNTKTTDVNPKPPAQSQPLPHDQWNMSMNTNMNSMSISSAGQSVKSKSQSQSQPQVTGARLQPPSLLFQPQRQNQNASSAYPQLSSHSQSQKNVSERRQGTPSPSPLHNLTLPVLPAALTSYKNPIGAGSISAGSATGSTSISASASNSASFASKMQGKLMPNLAPAPHSPYQQSYQHQHSMSKSTSGVGVNPRGRSTSMSDHSQHSHSHSHSNPHSHSHTHRPSPYPPKQPATSSWQHQHQHHSQHQSYRNSAHTTGKNAITGSPNSRPHSLHHQSSHHTSHSHSHSSHPHQSHQFQPSTGGSRSPPEVLKTLLRKKACLYEAGTSRAIALVTWLVGRNLALHQGYFSRQRLQAGVHAVVASKIDSGMITRTKVNRCMQIILNSCFHYIIPRPDGSEENGDAFCNMFRETVVDDVHLLKSLLPPWHDLDIAEAEKLMHQKDVDLSLSPKSSGSGNGSVATGSPSTVVTAAKGGGKKNKGSGSASTTSHASYAESQAKRVVLLCFNENVRSAEDVLRCHNDFIRDAAISSNLHLTSDEWRYFFSRKDDDCSQTSGSHTLDSATSGGGIGAGTSPQMRGAEGGDIPYLSFDIPVEVSSSMDFEDSMASDSKTKCNDVLGQMCSNEICKFRTSWCCKRYDHDTRLCKFAHVGENKGWLRRDPNVYSYSDKLCPYTTVIKSDDPSFDPSLNGCHVNGCKDGLLCKFAHSQEEVDYHPKRYKTKLCEAAKANSYSRPCTLLDICPLSHPSYPGHHQRSGRRRNNSFSSRKGGDVKHNSQPDGDGSDKYHAPPGAPMLYLSPAPMSDFEKSFQFPGLQSLFRRNSTVHYANCLGKEGTKFCLFGDTCGLKDPLFQLAHGGTNSFSLYSE